ncbi:glycine--tRNA ligase [Candidatus Uhrbacteria bacterium]|nr:glycine--tRNA ligase [Candidatus Uhrbacteria bacterium]
MVSDMDKLVSLCKRRGFIFPGSEIYGGLANSWDYGPVGVELKNNIKQAWWKRFVGLRSDMVGIDAALMMNPKVWEASGHVDNFTDPLADCKKCHQRFRADMISDEHAKTCGGELTEAKLFNLMFKTHLGPVEDASAVVYLRPETAQAMFADFKNVVDSSRVRIPFGIAQIGKAFRNEITPGNFIFRTREFEQMEIEYFIKEDRWQEHFEYWLNQMKEWMKFCGLSEKNLHFYEIPDGERAHYSKRTVDIEYSFPFGMKELYGIAYRTDFDLKRHQEYSGKDLRYTDPQTQEKYLPHVIEPTFGVDRTLLAVLSEHFYEEEDRIVLKLPTPLAPYKTAVFPLLANKPQLVEKAQELLSDLSTTYPIAWDDRGNIGKRYYAQDEIGTPFCITVDFETLDTDTVTVRDRDSMKQERIAIHELKEYLKEKL